MTINNNKSLSYVVSAMHSVARSNPELLDALLTNKVLELVIKDVDENMKKYLSFYLTHKKISLSEPGSTSKSLMSLNGVELASHYKLYEAYEPLMRKRNINIELETDVDLVRSELIISGLLNKYQRQR